MSHAPAKPAHASNSGSTQHDAPTKAATAAVMPKPDSNFGVRHSIIVSGMHGLRRGTVVTSSLCLRDPKARNGDAVEVMKIAAGEEEDGFPARASLAPMDAKAPTPKRPAVYKKKQGQISN